MGRKLTLLKWVPKSILVAGEFDLLLLNNIYSLIGTGNVQTDKESIDLILKLIANVGKSAICIDVLLKDSYYSN